MITRTTRDGSTFITDDQLLDVLDTFEVPSIWPTTLTSLDSTTTSRHDHNHRGLGPEEQLVCSESETEQ